MQPLTCGKCRTVPLWDRGRSGPAQCADISKVVRTEPLALFTLQWTWDMGGGGVGCKQAGPGLLAWAAFLELQIPIADAQ